MKLQLNKLWSGLAALNLLIILWLSLMPNNGPPPELEHLDKLWHFLAYLLSSLYFQQVFLNQKQWKVGIGLFCYGALMEGLQYLSATRGVEFLDLLANAVGIFAGILISKYLFKDFLIRLDSFFYTLMRNFIPGRRR